MEFPLLSSGVICALGRFEGRDPRQSVRYDSPMAGKDPVLERIAALDAVLEDPESKTSRRRIRDALTKKTALVVARAAELALELRWSDLSSDLRTAFFRILEAGWQADRGCRAKQAIVEALDGLDAREHDVFITGVRHVQLEPAWGDPVDTAVGLRGISAVALVNSRYYDAPNLLAVLLADREHRARASAAAALGAIDPMRAVPLLRHKAVCGDPELEVTTEVFTALLQLEEEPSVDFIVGFLHSNKAGVAEAAALSLGRSRLDQSLTALERWVASLPTGHATRKVAYVAIATHRSPSSQDCLCTAIENAELEDALFALEALTIYRHDRALMKRVEGMVKSRNHRQLLRMFETIESE